MSIAQTIALNWRAITAFLMAGVQLAVATGVLPVGSEATANTLIGSAGLVIATIAGGSYVQNIATANQQTASAGAVRSAAGALGEASQAVQMAAVAQPTPDLVRAAAAAAPVAATVRQVLGR